MLVRISKTERGLVYKNGDFVKLIMPGEHRVYFSEVKKYYVNFKFIPETDLSILLEATELKNELKIVDVKDNEIVICYVDKIFKEILKPGRHAFWKSNIDISFKIVDLNNPQIDESVEKKLFLKPEFTEYVSLFIIEPFEKGLFFIDKKFQNELEPGRYYFWKGTKDIRIDKVDIRLRQLDIQGQEIMTKDKVTLRFNFTCQYKISNPYIALNEVANYANELYVLLQLVLREYVGAFTLDEILLKKEEIGTYVTEKLKAQAEKLGIELIFSGVKDVILPGEIKDILNQVLIAEKKAQANVIMRREETASTRSLLNTAKLMEDNELLFKLKELEYIERISEKINQISISGGSQILEQMKQIFVQLKNEPKEK